MIYELLKLLKVHERDIVQVSEDLAIKHNALRNTSVTTSLWVWWMELAVIVDCVSLIPLQGAILTLLVWSMSFGTLTAHVGDILIECFVLTILNHSLVLVHAIWALCVRRMCAFGLRWCDWGRLTEAFEALAGSSAGTFLNLSIFIICWVLLLFFGRFGA